MLRHPDGGCGALQGLLISILVGVGVIHSGKDGRNLQNFLICLEMLPASIFMFFAFPFEEYKVTGEALSSQFRSGKRPLCAQHFSG